jgi:hypothetical protein
MAYTKGQPILVIIEEGVKADGLLEKGYDWYVMSVKPEVNVLTTPEFNGVLSSWKKKVEEFNANKNTKLITDQKIVPENFSISELLKSLKPASIWGIVVALFTLLSGSFYLGQYWTHKMAHDHPYESTGDTITPINKPTKDSTALKNGPSKKPFYIGQYYGGGVIYYVDYTGYHGFIVDTMSRRPEAPFTVDRKGRGIEGAGSRSNGKLNTNNIVLAVGDTGFYAAKMCKDYRGGGFNDWYLPALDQLSELFKQKEVLKLHGDFDFSDVFFWSSTMNGTNACHVNFHMDDSKGVAYLHDINGVFAIRSF